MISYLKRYFLPTEISVIIYVLITSLYISFHSSEVTNILYISALRTSILIIIIGILIVSNKNLNETIHNIRWFIPFLFLAFFYNETDLINNFIFQANLDIKISTLEYSIFNKQPSLVFSTKLSLNWISELMYFAYFSYYLMVLGIPAFFYFRIDKTLGKKAISIIIISFLIYYLIFILIPVAGPQFYFTGSQPPVPEGYVFGSLIKTIQFYGEGQTAAFPSSHVSICLMLFWLTFKNSRILFRIMLPVTIMLIFSTVYIRAHYLLDVIAAIIITPFVYMASVKIYNYLES